MKEAEAKQMNTAALAYLGDAVYEVAIRKHLMETGQTHVDKLHKQAVRYVRAESQALAVKKIFDELSETEQRLVKRARNKKITSKPRNADPVTYKLATAFEALIGYLYLSEQKDRMEWVIEQTVNVVNTMGAENVKRKKQTRNKARDIFTDYYKSNREYDAENRRRQQEQTGKSGWSGTEKLYLTVIVLGLIGIVVKYVIL